MQLNLSKVPLPVYDAYALSVKLGLSLSRRQLDVNYVYYTLLNHGSPVGLVYISVRKCRPLTITLNYLVTEAVIDKISDDDVFDLVFRKTGTHYIFFNNKLISNSYKKALCPLPNKKPVPFVVLVLMDSRGNVFIGYRCDHCCWSPPTETIEEGEKPIETAKRGLYEELKIQVPLQRLFVFTSPQNKLVFVYSGKVSDWSEIVNRDFAVQPIWNLVHKHHLKHIKQSGYVLRTVAKHLS